MADVVERVRPSVVRIETNRGSGSGLVFETVPGTGAALVLTNHHVVEAASLIEVVAHDGSTYVASRRSQDADRDLTVVEICCSDSWMASPLADDSLVRVGDSVMAMGYPLGLQTMTVTVGIVSALYPDEALDLSWIQIDAAVNPGNSGGPLVSQDGSVVGIISARYVASEGMGLAVAATTAASVMPQLMVTPTPTPSPTPTPVPIVISLDFGATLAAIDGWPVDLAGFKAVSSDPHDVLYASILWGDGGGYGPSLPVETTGAVTASHMYPAPDVYILTIKVWGISGAEASATTAALVRPSPASAPVATPSLTPAMTTATVSVDRFGARTPVGLPSPIGDADGDGWIDGDDVTIEPSRTWSRTGIAVWQVGAWSDRMVIVACVSGCGGSEEGIVIRWMTYD